MEKALNNSGPAAAKPGHRAKRAEPGRRGAKDALEWLMHTIFLLCGIVAVGFVLVISVYLIISGVPAMKEIGLTDFLLGQTWAPTASDPSYGILPFILTSIYGRVIWSSLICTYIGFFLFGLVCIALGIFISSLTENQVVAAVVGMIVLLALALIDVVARYAESVPVVPTVLNALSFYTRYYDFTAGLFDPASVLFYVSTAVIFNFFTVRVFEKRRWS